MIVKKTLIRNIAISLIFTACIISFSETPFLKHIDLLTFDSFFRLRGPQKSSIEKIITIEVSDADVHKLNKWPFKRIWTAKLIKILNELGAKYICIDILFTEPSENKDDDLLAVAMKKANNVFIPAFLNSQFQEFGKKIITPTKKFSEAAKKIGSCTTRVDLDGKIREVPSYIKSNDQVFFNISLLLAMDYLNLKIKNISPSEITLANENKTIKVPITEEKNLTINWKGTWGKEFKHFSYLEILDAYEAKKQNKKTNIDLSIFKDSVCFFGITIIGLYDIRSTPLDSSYPGLGIVATIFDNIVTENFIRELPHWFNILLIYFLSLFPAFIITEENPFRDVLTLFLLLIVFSAAYFCFLLGYKLQVSLALVGILGNYIILSSYVFILVHFEKKRFVKLAITDDLTGLFNIRYFNIILNTCCSEAKKSPQKYFCILLCDLDNFKNINDTYGHQIGDLVLINVAKSIKTTLRTLDVVARYGGEEIIILLNHVSINNALKISENIRKNIESLEIKNNDTTYKITLSIGIASFNKETDTPQSLIKRADQSLYKAKNSGKNSIHTFDK